MNIQLISFATPNFYFSQYKLIKTAKQFGINNIYLYNHQDFKKTIFYKENITITSQNRGAGYWIWKPYYIYEHLLNIQEGEILVYSDSGIQIIANLDPLFKIANESATGIILFENYQGSAYFAKSKSFEVDYNGLYVEPNKNKYWCKNDIFDAVDFADTSLVESPQVDANVMIFKKSKYSLQFVQEWLNLCKNPQLITDSPALSRNTKLNTFFGHLHDQSIISVLAAKWKIELFRSPTQFGNHYKLPFFRNSNDFLLLPYSSNPKINSNYDTLFLHTRFRTIPFLMRCNNFILLEAKLVYARVSLILFRLFNNS